MLPDFLTITIFLVASAWRLWRQGRLFESDHPDNKGAKKGPFSICVTMYITYILFSPGLNKYYSGQTSNLHRRLIEHNRGKTKFMSSGIPWVLVFQREFKTRSEASQLEKKIKSRGAARFLDDNNISGG